MPIGDSLRADLFEELKGALLAGFVAGAAGVAGTGPREVDEGLFGNFAASWAARRAGDLITRVDRTSRLAARASIAAGLEAGLTPREMSDSLDAAIFGDERRLMIARTEAAIAYNQGEAERWFAEGIRFVRIVDGVGDAKCKRANGQVWSIERYMRNPTAHPNCERSAIALVDYVPRGTEITDVEELDLAA